MVCEPLLAQLMVHTLTRGTPTKSPLRAPDRHLAPRPVATARVRADSSSEKLLLTPEDCGFLGKWPPQLGARRFWPSSALTATEDVLEGVALDRTHLAHLTSSPKRRSLSERWRGLLRDPEPGLCGHGSWTSFLQVCSGRLVTLRTHVDAAGQLARGLKWRAGK